jgi:hypothetical protein
LLAWCHWIWRAGSAEEVERAILIIQVQELGGIGIRDDPAIVGRLLRGERSEEERCVTARRGSRRGAVRPCEDGAYVTSARLTIGGT